MGTCGVIRSYNSCICSALHGIPDQASICFLNIQKLDPSPITTLFDQLSIPYFRNFVFLVYRASPPILEKALLSALELDIVIPPSFITASQRLTFELIDGQLLVRLIKATQENLLALQITRGTIGTTNEVFFTPSFMSFLKLRFLCQDSPQIQTVKNNAGDVTDVLTFTSSVLLFDTLPRNQLPYTFDFDNLSFTLSHMEPLFVSRPKSLVTYPYETQQEHLQRFIRDEDSLASRIPLLLPHPDKGGPSAESLILSMIPSFLPLSDPTITYLPSSSSPEFYIFLSPFYEEWTSSIAHMFPTQSLTFRNSPLHEPTMTTPFCIILDPISGQPFPIPSFHTHPVNTASFGWISVTSFSSTNVLLLTPSQTHVNHLYKFIQNHSHLFSPTIILGQASVIELSLDPLINLETTPARYGS